VTSQVVRERLEVVSTLRQLARSGEAIYADLNGEARPALRTRLLAVNPDFEEMIFDCFDDASANRRAMQTEQVNFQCWVDGVELRFYAGKGEATVHSGHPALRLRLPARMLRLQRREYYRVPTALPCEVVLEAEGKVRVLEMRASDLSLGGLRLVTDQAVGVEPGRVFDKCHLKMGDEGNLTASLEVRSVDAGETPKGGARLRLGCRFLSLTPALEHHLSRFIAKLERRALR